LSKIVKLERTNPGTLIDCVVTTTDNGTAGITVIENPRDIDWVDASKPAIVNNLFLLTIALLADTLSRIREAQVKSKPVMLLLTTDLEGNPCQDPLEVRQVIESLEVISWNQHPLRLSTQQTEESSAAWRRRKPRRARGHVTGSGGRISSASFPTQKISAMGACAL
jgi:hypothetical protein